MKTYYLVEGVLYDNDGNKVADVVGTQRSVVLLDNGNSLRRDLEKSGHVGPNDEVFVLL